MRGTRRGKRRGKLFEKRIGASANSAKSQSDIRVSPATFAYGKFAQLGYAEL